MTPTTAVPTKGEASREGSEAMRELWAEADKLNRKPRPAGGHWVPWDAVAIRHSILPRLDDFPDATTVDHYAEILERLPPIEVQRGTYVLIDGLHRLHAFQATSDFVPIIERDCEDYYLPLRALQANLQHGRALSARERRAGLDMALRLLGPESDAPWTDERIAGLTGYSVATVRAAIARAQEREWATPSGTGQSIRDLRTAINSGSKVPEHPQSPARTGAAATPSVSAASDAYPLVDTTPDILALLQTLLTFLLEGNEQTHRDQAVAMWSQMARLAAVRVAQLQGRG